MRRLYIYICLLIAISTMIPVSLAQCIPPADLQAKLRSHPEADSYARAAAWYTRQGKFECANEAYRSALRQQPKSPDLLYLMGLNLIRKGDVSAAVKPLQESIELKPDVLKPHLLLATTLEQLGRAAEARTEWNAALKVDPHSEMALDGASKNLLATREFDVVVGLIGPEPKGEDLILDLASAYRGGGQTEQAIEVLRKGLEADPSSRILTAELITNLLSERRFEEPAKLAQQLAQRYPHDINVQVLYLNVLVVNDDEHLARPLARKLLLAAPRDFMVLYLNGVLERRSGNYAGACSYLEKAVSINPNHYESRFNLGLALLNLNDLQRAKEQFEKALALGDPDPGVRFQYVKVLRALGESRLAQEQFRLYQDAQKSLADRTLAANSMGQADKELNQDPKKAAQLYRDAIAALPDYALLQYKLSVALDRTGDLEGEREALRKAVELDPRMAIAHRQLGYLAFNDGDFATAERHFREAVEAAPTFTDAWVSLAATLASESRREEAEQAVKRALEIDPHNANAIDLQNELAKAVSQAHP